MYFYEKQGTYDILYTHCKLSLRNFTNGTGILEHQYTLFWLLVLILYL
jgi:hypothetical protein